MWRVMVGGGMSHHHLSTNYNSSRGLVEVFFFSFGANSDFYSTTSNTQKHDYVYILTILLLCVDNESSNGSPYKF